MPGAQTIIDENDAAASHAATPSGGPLRRLTARCDLWILASFLLGTLVRVYAFDAVPPGLNQDEASSGYDAWALMHYGIDRNGFHNPVAMVAWGSGMSVLTPLIMMPFIGCLGLTVFAMRLPFLLAGAASILLFAELVKRIAGAPAARLAAFFLAISPWHIMISRWAHEANLFPFALLLGVLVAVVSLRRPWLLPVSFAIFGMATYCYGPALVVVPLYLMILLPYAIYHRCWPWKPLIVAVSALALITLPIYLYAAVNLLQRDSIITPWLSIPRLPSRPRYETMGNFKFWEAHFYEKAGRNYAEAARLAIFQDDGLIWNAVPGYGVMYLFGLPFALGGFLLLCRDCCRREFVPAFFAWAWCVTLLVMLTFFTPHFHRYNLAVIPLVYCTARSVLFLCNRARPIFYGVVVVYLIAFAGFSWAYFGRYVDQVGPKFFPGLIEAIQAASANPGDRICVTGQIMFPYIYALMVDHVDPHEFLKTRQFLDPTAEFQLVKSFGRYEFGVPQEYRPDIDVFVFYPTDAWFSPDQYQIDTFGDFNVIRRRND